MRTQHRHGRPAPCLESHSPLDLVAIMLGTNDCKRKFGYSVLDIAWEMERFLEKVWTHRHFAAQDHYRVLLIAPPPMTEAIRTSWLGDVFAYDEGRAKSEKLAEVYREVSQRYDCAFLNAADYASASPCDGIHLDSENQRKLGEAVAEAVRTLLSNS